MKKMKAPVQISTGYTNIDKVLGPLQPGEVTVVMNVSPECPQMLATKIMANCCRKDAEVDFYAFRSSDKRIEQVILAQEAGLSALRMSGSSFTFNELQRLLMATKTVNCWEKAVFDGHQRCYFKDPDDTGSIGSIGEVEGIFEMSMIDDEVPELFIFDAITYLRNPLDNLDCLGVLNRLKTLAQKYSSHLLFCQEFGDLEDDEYDLMLRTCDNVIQIHSSSEQAALDCDEDSCEKRREYGERPRVVDLMVRKGKGEFVPLQLTYEPLLTRFIES